ncbi:MAG: PP2C family protein-serine/threonine phosphatase [Planctomycetota bacterium]
MKLILVGMTLDALPHETVSWLRERRWEMCAVEDHQAASAQLDADQVQAVVVAHANSSRDDVHEAGSFKRFLQRLDERLIPAVVLGSGDRALTSDSESLVEDISGAVSGDELRGRLATMECYQPVVARLDKELRNIERVGERLERHLSDVDREMRLAARLQHEFLPSLDKPINGLSFASFYRPASWVSGDLYDVIAVDDAHTAFYIVDAVGHGVAAGLLTMFIKRTIAVSESRDSVLRPVCPSLVLARLNDALADQALPNCPFVTACYGLFNHQTLELQCSAGGHPPPLRIGVDGGVQEMEMDGSLLGLQRGETFDVTKTHVRPGEKILFYSDGIEIALGHSPSKWWQHGIGQRGFNRSIGELIKSIEFQLDSVAGSLHAADDVTLLGLEVPVAPQSVLQEQPPSQSSCFNNPFGAETGFA